VSGARCPGTVLARLADNTGQACNAGKRIIVHEGLHEHLLARFATRMSTVEPAPLFVTTNGERWEQEVAQALGRARH